MRFNLYITPHWSDWSEWLVFAMMPGGRQAWFEANGEKASEHFWRHDPILGRPERSRFFTREGEYVG